MEPSRRPATTLLSQGTVLEDRYEILRICGRGGMSTVYAARDLRFKHVERLCAIKEMHVVAPDNQTRVLRIANFEQEAAMLATLSHPAIPKIFDFFTDGGLIYLVLEFIDGQDLESLVEQQSDPLSEDTLISWGLQILDVLSFLHEHQPEPIVFRDLKPSNIMLRVDGSLALIDFGIARTFQPMQKGTMIGTEGYAPPEQYRGVAEPRGDLYALGATLHHLATGSDPRSETPFTFEQRPARSLNPELSQGFEEVLNGALAYSAADRFPSAAAMAQAFRRVLADDHVSATSNGLPQPSVEPARDDDVAIVHSAPDPTLAELPVPEAPLPDGTMPAKERIIWAVQTGDEVRGSPTVVNRRAYIGSYDGYVYSLGASDGTINWRFRCQRGVVARPMVLDETVVIGSEDQHAYGLRAANGRLKWSFRTAMPVRSSASAFSDAAVFGCDDSYCYCVDVQQGNLLWRHRTWGPVRSSPTVYKDHVVIGSDDGAVYCFSAPDGRLKWRSQLGDRVLSSPAVESETVIVGNADGGVYALRFQDGERLWHFQTQRPVLGSPRVLGSSAFIGSTDGAIYAMNIEDGTELWRNQIANQITSTIAIHGGYGYVGTIDGFIHCINLKDGEIVWRYRVGGAVTSSPAISDGVVVVGSLDGKIYGLRM